MHVLKVVSPIHRVAKENIRSPAIYLTVSARDGMAEYLGGKRLYGDDFSERQLEEWFTDEAEGYFGLQEGRQRPAKYPYLGVVSIHGYDLLPKIRFSHVLGFGSAAGEEFEPIHASVSKFTIIESSIGFDRSAIKGVPAEYIRAKPSGSLPIPDSTFDLCCCFGVLHHIANVSHSVREIARCLKPGGYFLLSEPIVSMGDWRYPRSGVTKRERGIPLNILRQIALESGLAIERESLHTFPPLAEFAKLARWQLYTFRGWAVIDAIFCKAFQWNLKYHRETLFERSGPADVFMVLRKGG